MNNYRYKIVIEYVGTQYMGWQYQEHGRTVQLALVEAIAHITGEKSEVINLVGAGRTDSGVHAVGQVAHFDLHKQWDGEKLMSGINHVLRTMGDSIAVKHCEEVRVEFNARFDAKLRRYVYKIVESRSASIFMRDMVWAVGHDLDICNISAMCNVLVGMHDFTSFRNKHCQAHSPVRTISNIGVARCRNIFQNEVHITITAQSFLHNQVRIIVGTLVYLSKSGGGKQEIRDILEARDRTRAMSTAPACGLYLSEVRY